MIEYRGYGEVLDHGPSRANPSVANYMSASDALPVIDVVETRARKKKYPLTIGGVRGGFPSLRKQARA